jgi:type IV secretory pathway VirB10-like protein
MSQPPPFAAGRASVPSGSRFPWGKILLAVVPILLLLLVWVFGGFSSSGTKKAKDQPTPTARLSGKDPLAGMPKSHVGVRQNGADPGPVIIHASPSEAPAPDHSPKEPQNQALIDELTRQNQMLIEELKKARDKPPVAPQVAAPVRVDPDAQARKAEAKRLAEERRKEEKDAKDTLVFHKAERSQKELLHGPGLHPPIAPIMLQQGWKVNCSVEHEINSDIPGEIVARTLSPVYDSINGTVELIPPGSTLYGRQRGAVKFGEQRIPGVFSRLNFQNGSSLKFGKDLTILDASGQAGMTGDIDNHWGRLFASVIITGVLKGGAMGMGGYGGDIPQQIAGSVGQEASSEGQEKTKQFLNTNPTIIAAKGEGCLLIIDDDIAWPSQALQASR